MDQKALKLVQKQGVKLLSPGFIVELFVFDISNDVEIYGNEYYVRHTGVVKILATSEFNDDIKTHKDLKPGDIVLMGDHMSVMKKNPDYEDWEAEQLTNVNSARKAPIEFIKGFHIQLSQGRLFYINRGESLVEGKNLRFGEDEVKDYRGPYVFFADPQDILYGVENPFADIMDVIESEHVAV